MMDMPPSTSSVSTVKIPHSNSPAGSDVGSRDVNRDEYQSAIAQEHRLLGVAERLLTRAQNMENRLTEIEIAGQSCKCAQAVCETVTDILGRATTLLLNMRETGDPAARSLLGESFNRILDQIDLIVADAYYDDRNLARGDSIVVSADSSRLQKFSITGVDMTARGLDLERLQPNAIPNADIVIRLTKIDTAIGLLTAHSYSYDSIASLLQSRTRFARGMVEILEEGGKQIHDSRAGQQAMAQVFSALSREILTAKKIPSNHQAPGASDN